MDVGDKLPTVLRGTGEMRDLVQDAPPARLPADLRARLAGFIETRPNWDGVVTIEGHFVHHWIHISAGEAISMAGFLTPQLITQLGGAEMPDPTALSDTMGRPERLAAQLRSAQVAGNAAALTGHLVGAELAATKVYWLGQEVVLMGPGRYLGGLKAQGASVTQNALTH